MSDPAPAQPPAMEADAPAPALTQVTVPERTALPALPKLPWALIVPFALVPVALAAWQLGRWHPDEVYQFLEPAFFRVRGYGVHAWEWRVGLRNWGVPLVLSVFLRLSDALGLTDPRAYRAVVALPLLALHLAALVSVWRYAERKVGRLGFGWTTFAFVLFSASAPIVLFSGRTMGENLSAAFLLIAFERLDRERAALQDGLVAGAMLGFAVVARYGSAVFVVAALVWLVAMRRWRLLLWTCVAGAVVAAGLGALDWWTWNRPFHSLREYLEYNVFSKRAAQQFGESPPEYYLPFIFIWVAAWAWPGVIATSWRERRIPAAVFAAVTYLVAISLTAHKEDRFIHPAVVLLLMVGAPGAAWLVDKVRSANLRLLTAVAALATGCVGFFFAPNFMGDEFRAIVKATRDPQATGLLIIGDGIWGSGGQFYIGKNLPFVNGIDPGHVASLIRDPRINRVVAMEGRNLELLERSGFEVVDRIDQATILWRKQ